MSELKKLTKNVEKAKEAFEARRADLDTAVTQYGTAVAAHAVAREALEQAQAIEAARELRAKKAAADDA